jgi:hypothetical protein
MEVVSTDQLPVDQPIRIYPNPASHTLNIILDGPGTQLLDISSITGRRLFRQEVEGETLQIDIASFPKGVYVISLSNGDHVAIDKFIKL